ncbi:unannotated protein [freshwater metagenome]|uniref:Unannotated protein n=1 Tax=freshwater metagenome TaxID=449393 RepID=A0A6J6MTS8_9ZZZZ
MALSAEYIQTASSDHFIVFCSNCSGGLLKCAPPRGVVRIWIVSQGKATLCKSCGCHRFWVATKHDVRATASHVRGNSYRTLATCLRHDLRFAIVVLSVQDFMRHTILAQQLAEEFRFINRGCAHENRLTLCVPLNDVSNHCLQLCIIGAVDNVGIIKTDHVAVRWNRHHTEVVNLGELVGFGHCSTGHT